MASQRSELFRRQFYTQLVEEFNIFDAFADISVAASATQKEEQQIDDKTFGKLIQDEIDRINAENGNPLPPRVEPIGTKLKESVIPEVNESRESAPDEDESISGYFAPAFQSEEQPEPESEKTPVEPEPQEIMPEFFTPEALMEYAESKGITVKDNREKGGCLWIKADQMTDDLVKSQVFGDRKFKFSAKSKALQGEAGWYY